MNAKNLRTAVIGVFAGASLLASSAAIGFETPLPDGETRLAGSTRYGTAVAISAKSFTSPIDVAYVASGVNYPDALTAGPAAAKRGAPILLVGTTGVNEETKAELNRLAPETIYAVGGESAISRTTVTELAEYAEVVRIAGDDRYATAAKISSSTWDSASTVFIASGGTFADALSAGPAGAKLDSPLLLTSPTYLPEATRAELARLAPTQVYVLGGVSAVSDAVTQDIGVTTGAKVFRIAGSDRYETSAAVARVFWSTKPAVFFGTGADFPDAVAGTPAAAVNDAPILLTKSTCMPAPIGALMEQFNPRRVVILGGLTAIDDGITDLSCSGPPYTQRASVALDGTEANGDSFLPTVSGDGRYVAYLSDAWNLVPDDRNGVTDVLVWDRVTRSTTWIGSQDSDHRQAIDAPSISNDGRFVAYGSGLWDRAANTTTQLPVAGADLSATGRYVAFSNSYQLGVLDVETGDSSLLSVSRPSDPAVSGDGRYITFHTSAADVVPGDTNGNSDVFVWDRTRGDVLLVSSGLDSAQANGRSLFGAISADGRYIAYRSEASNLVPDDSNGSDDDVFLWDRTTRTTTRVGTYTGNYGPSISADGRFIAYNSDYAQVSVWDRENGRRARVNLTHDGRDILGAWSSSSEISADGRFVTYSSDLWGLVPWDTNGMEDVFVSRNILLDD